MKKILMPILLTAALWGYGEGVIYWMPAGCESGQPLHGKHGGHGSTENTILSVINLEGNSSATLIKPDLSTETLPIKATALTVPKPNRGGYYALVLTQRTEYEVKSGLRYISLQGRPSKISPTKLTALSKADLEIVPDPLHREHDHYSASKTYRFIVKFHDAPLAHLLVVLETKNHSTQTYTSDDKGAVEVTLPNDFKNVRIGKGDNKPSEFLLLARYADGKRLFLTTLSMPYFVNPNDYWQSQSYGAGAIFIGFLSGLFLYRRHKKQGVSRG